MFSPSSSATLGSPVLPIRVLRDDDRSPLWSDDSLTDFSPASPCRASFLSFESLISLHSAWSVHGGDSTFYTLLVPTSKEESKSYLDMGAEDNEDEVKSEGVLECLPNSIEESENIIFGQLEPDVKVDTSRTGYWKSLVSVTNTVSLPDIEDSDEDMAHMKVDGESSENMLGLTFGTSSESLTCGLPSLEADTSCMLPKLSGGPSPLQLNACLNDLEDLIELLGDEHSPPVLVQESSALRHRVLDWLHGVSIAMEDQ